MDQISQNELDRIIALGPDSVSETEIAFLRARRDYLTEEQKVVFASVLQAPQAEESAEDAGETAAAPRKRKQS